MGPETVSHVEDQVVWHASYSQLPTIIILLFIICFSTIQRIQISELITAFRLEEHKRFEIIKDLNAIILDSMHTVFFYSAFDSVTRSYLLSWWKWCNQTSSWVRSAWVNLRCIFLWVRWDYSSMTISIVALDCLNSLLLENDSTSCSVRLRVWSE